MDTDKMEEITEKIVTAATTDEGDPLSMVDQALDAMVAAIGVIEDNLPKVQTDNVPQKAALDSVKELMDTAIGPYLADALKAMQVFGEE